MRPILGQPVIIENVGGAGGSMRSAASRARRPTATPSIGQWDTRNGSIIYNLNRDLQTDFTPSGVD